MIATAGVPSRFGTLQLWNREGELERFVALPDGTSPSEIIERIAFDRQGEYVLSSSKSGYRL